MVRPEAFLAIESSLTLRLASTLDKLTSRLYKRIQKLLDRKDFSEAERLLREVDLSPVFRANESYIAYISKVAVLFGASRVTNTPGTSAVGLGFEQPTVELMVQSLRLAIEYNLKESLVESGLQLIAKTREGGQVPQPRLMDIFKGEFSYLGHILKAGKKAAILPFESFMRKDGKAKLNIASSLHTSRLSAFGYTAEASYLGITHYQINEQLDGRTCPLCAMMHGKVFKVRDARNLLDVVIRTQDPDELKSLQSWPGQSKDDLAQLGSMTPEQIVSRGWHVPPFHPRCRGLLSKAGSVPQLSANKNTPPPPEAYLADREDFLQFGVKLSPSKIDLWNSLMKTSPSEVIARLSGVSQDKLLASIADAADPKMASGVHTLSVTPTGVNIELRNHAFNSKFPVTQDYYFRKDLSLFVGLIEVHPDDSPLLRKVLRTLYGVSKSTAMEAISVVADLDSNGYAFAKMGFSLAPRQWELLKSQIQKSVAKTAWVDSASDLEKSAYSLIMGSPDPKNIFALADLPTLGAKLLQDTAWFGSLDLGDPESISRFISVVGGQS